jgi:hypothetical protein
VYVGSEFYWRVYRITILDTAFLICIEDETNGFHEDVGNDVPYYSTSHPAQNNRHNIPPFPCRIRLAMSMPTATAKPSSGASIVVPENSLQLTRSGRYIILYIHRGKSEPGYRSRYSD